MSDADQLSKDHEGMILNKTSIKQEAKLQRAVERVIESLKEEFGTLNIVLQKTYKLANIEAKLRKAFPDVEFAEVTKSSFMRPDGGIVNLRSADGELFPILISEVKSQGTNERRIAEGKEPQAKGNAVERLGKNVIGLRCALLNESIFPFVCFGDGCDFDVGSTIRDRVVVVAKFGELNKEHLYKVGPGDIFDRGSYYFRAEKWTEDEMYERCFSIAERSVLYYFSKYGKESFL